MELVYLIGVSVVEQQLPVRVAGQQAVAGGVVPRARDGAQVRQRARPRQGGARERVDVQLAVSSWRQ